MALLSKIKWILGVLLIFILIVATNLIDRSNFKLVRDSVATIYEDRLVAKDIIYDMCQLLQEKELALAKSDSLFFLNKNEKVNENLQELAIRFEKTTLTNPEAKALNKFKANLVSLASIESNFIQSGFLEEGNLSNKIIELKDGLQTLSEIQLSEGSKQVQISQRAMNTVNLFTHLEIYVLIFLAIVIQFIVMYSPKKEA